MKRRLPISVIFFCLLVGMLSTQCQRKTAQFIQPAVHITSAQVVEIDSAAFGNGACEPSICINPVNPDNIVAGSILDRVYVSDNGGKTWTKSQLKSSSGVYGDPVVRADYAGNFYYAHLSNPTGRAWVDEDFLDRIVIQKSQDGGKTWNDGTFTPPRNPKDQDKQWLAVDPRNNDVVMTWTEFDNYGSKAPEDRSRILFTKTSDGGNTWTEPLAINQFDGDCIDDDDTTEGAVPAVGVDGQIYVAWSYAEKIYFDRSMDGGKTWMAEDVVVADQPGGWTIDIPGIYRCNGMPVTEVDNSDGPFGGTIYVNWADQRHGEHDTDIWIAKSTDQGLTWSDPMRVNDDEAGKHQFLTWMDVDPHTGYIYIVFYDRRAYDDEQTDVYLAYSTDGGNHFVNTKISQSPFKPNRFVFFGDYSDISAYNGRVRPIWTRLDGMRLSVRTALLDVH